MTFHEAMFIQTTHPTLDDMGLVEAHHKLISTNLDWSKVGIFTDQEAGSQKSVLTILLDKEIVAAVFRVCLETPEKTLEAINLFVNDEEPNIIFRVYQGEYFTLEEIRSLPTLNKLWKITSAQSTELNPIQQISVYKKIFSEFREKGRGKDFSSGTKQKVNMDAHGRCMYRGCGLNLKIDGLSGEAGNYGYLAHNVASAERGPRGIPGISEELSDNPSNVLLLCDKHHRLIDKIAAVDYPAHQLSKMRFDFCNTAARLLNALSYDPVPATAVLWPVQRTVISAPSNLQISQSLAKKKWRLSSTLISPCSDNDSIFRNLSPDKIRSLWPDLIVNAAEKVMSCIGDNQYRSALFAFGPMPQLIALGAKLGNKQEIIPMLRFRDGNQWIWPADKPQGACYDITGLSELGENENEIILLLNITNKPPQFDSFVAQKGLKKVEITANNNSMGNGAIGHPHDGIEFMADIQRLLHKLKDSHGVKTVHLLPCASNAACVFFGKAFDIHHPELIVYDFSKKEMIPFLKITNKKTQCEIELVDV
ncbi:SAVED domain-containing protein [Desulforhopalus sp. 52FAK]